MYCSSNSASFGAIIISISTLTVRIRQEKFVPGHSMGPRKAWAPPCVPFGFGWRFGRQSVRFGNEHYLLTMRAVFVFLGLVFFAFCAPAQTRLPLSTIIPGTENVQLI